MTALTLAASLLLLLPLNIADAGGDAEGQSFSWGEDAEALWSWDEAWRRSESFTPGALPRLFFGYTKSVYWFRMNWTGGGGRRYLSVFSTQTDHVDFRFRTSGGWGPSVRLGDAAAFDPQLLRSAVPSVEFPLDRTGSVLVRVETTSALSFEPRVFDEDSRTRFSSSFLVLLGILCGFLVLMLLFNSFMFATVRDPLYIWYSLYLLSMGTYELIYAGFMQAVFPEAKPLYNNLALPFLALAVSAALHFAYRANHFEEWRGTRWLYGCLGALVATALGVFFLGSPREATQILNVTVVLASVTVLVGGLIQAGRGRRFSRFFAAGWMGFTATSALVALNVLQGGPATVGASLFLVPAFLFEITMLSAALADRVRLLQKDLDRHLQQAARDDRLATLGLVTARMGHEVNTPNHVIALNAASLVSLLRRLGESRVRAREEGLEVPEEEQWVTEATELSGAIRTASAQINQLVSGMRSAVQQPPLVRLDLAALVRQTAGLYEVRWREYGRIVTKAPELPVVVLGAETRLQQLIVNLTTNGLQSLLHRDSLVQIAVEKLENHVFLVVTDEGRGMVPEVLAQLGTPFFTTRGEQGGSGVGWGVCQEIVREHRAQMELESFPGKGTVVRVRFNEG